MKIDEREADLADFSAEMLAGQAVGKLVGRGDEEEDQPGQKEGVEAIETGNFSPDFAAVDDGDVEPNEDQGGGEHEEVGREAEPDLADKAVEEAIRIERLQPQVEGPPPNPATPGGRVPSLGSPSLEEPKPPEAFDELLDALRGDRGAKLLFGPPPDDV